MRRTSGGGYINASKEVYDVGWRRRRSHSSCARLSPNPLTMGSSPSSGRTRIRRGLDQPLPGQGQARPIRSRPRCAGASSRHGVERERGTRPRPLHLHRCRSHSPPPSRGWCRGGAPASTRPGRRRPCSGAPPLQPRAPAPGPRQETPGGRPPRHVGEAHGGETAERSILLHEHQGAALDARAAAPHPPGQGPTGPGQEAWMAPPTAYMCRPECLSCLGLTEKTRQTICVDHNHPHLQINKIIDRKNFEQTLR
jgi:hypothetical protein